MSNPNYATVRRTVGRGTSVPDALAILASACEAGAQCPEVQSNPVAAQALTALQNAVTTADTSLATRLKLATALIAAIKAMGDDFKVVMLAARTYESTVDSIAHGDAKIISKAGLQSRFQTTSQVALGKVSVVHSKAGKHPAESIITWPRGPGATGYAIQVNVTPQNPAGPWTALISGTGRRRIVKGPTPGSQVLVQVASLGREGTVRTLACEVAGIISLHQLT